MIEVDELEQMLPQSGGPNYFDTWDRHHSIAFTTATKGLHNAPGENNCFVNSAVQVFWHLDVFRRSYRRLSGHTCMGNSCIFCALKVIFTQFQFSDQSSLHPDALRKALAETFVNQQRFQLGHMDDAAECFENILRRIHFHIASNHSEDSCNTPHCLPHQKFALNIVEKVMCSCGGSSNPLKFTEMVHYISATALVSQARVLQQTGDTLHPDRFGLLLRNANALGDMRDCPRACGKVVQICRTLLNSPDVVSIGLVWDSDHPTVEMTTEVARNIGTTILLQDVFHSVMQDVRSLPRLQLVGLVCYYGKHYSTFVFHSKLQVWIYFDDATVREIGKSWEDVVEKCSRGRYQPLLLLYANPNAVPVPVDTAPKKRTMARGFDPSGDMDGLNKSQESISSQHIGQRPHTPNLEPTTSHRTQLLPPRSRSVTPSGSETSESFVRAAEHSRQQSFIMAVSSKPDDIKAKIPLRLGGQASSKVNLPGPMVPPSAPTSSYENSHYSKHTLLSSSQCKQPSVQDFEPVRVTIPPSFKIQDRREVNRKEPTRSDIARYPDLPSSAQMSNFQPQERSSYNHSDQPAGKFQNVPLHNKTQVFTSDMGYTNPTQRSMPFGVGEKDNPMDRSQENFHHTIVKPHAATQHIYEQGQAMFQSHTPVQSGLATLPRKKKEIPQDLNSQKNENKGLIGKSASVEHFSNGLEQQATTLMTVKPPLVAVRQCNNPVDDTPESDNRMKKLITKPENKLKSELSRSQPNLWKESQALQLCDSGSTRYSTEEALTKENVTYIDRKMVESILKHQGLKRNTSTLSTSSISTSDSGVMGKPPSGRSGPGSQNTDTSFDNVSLGSHKDSGYGSSDRNSSSSTGSGSVDPYIQYFISKSMVVPRSVNPQFLSQMGNNALNQRQQTSSSGTHGSRHTSPRQEINQHLSETFAQRQVMHPIKESSLEEILKEAPQGQATRVNVVSPTPTPYSLNAEVKPLTAPPKNLAAFQVSKSSHHTEPSIDSLDKDEVENAYFVSMCEKADNLMDGCIIAETKGELTEALRYCDSALGCLKEAMNQTDISNTALVYAQKKHNACLLKSRSLFKRTSSSQEGKRSSITSSDSDNSERPLRKIASKERLLAMSRGTSAQGISSQTAPNGKLPTSVSQQALTLNEGQPVAVQQLCAGGSVQTAPFKSEMQSQVQPHLARVHLSRSSVVDRSDSESTHSRSGSNSSARSSGSALSVTQQDPYQNAGRLSTEPKMSVHVPLDDYGTLPRNRQPRRTSDPTGSSDVYKSYLNRQKHVADSISSKSSGTKTFLKNSSEIQNNDVIHRLTSLNNSDSQQHLPDTLPAKTRNLTTDVKFQEQKHVSGRVGSTVFSTEDNGIMYSESSYTTSSNASCSTPMVSSMQQNSARLTLAQPGHNSIILQAAGDTHRSENSDSTFRNSKSLSVSSILPHPSLAPAAHQQQTSITCVQNVGKRGHPPPPPPARTSSDPESSFQLQESQKYQQQKLDLEGPGDSQSSSCRPPARTGKQKIVAQVQPNNHIDGSRRPMSSDGPGSTQTKQPHGSSSLGLYNNSYNKSLVQPGVTEGQGREEPSSYNMQGSIRSDPAVTSSSLAPHSRLSYHANSTTEFYLGGEPYANTSQTLNPTIAQTDRNVSVQPISENILHENCQQPSVKDLAYRFSKLLHKPAVKPKPPALSKPRTRSKSESVNIKPKSVLKTKKNKTSKSLRKSVTFAQDISNYAAGYESAGELRPKWVNEEASQRAFYSDDDDGGVDDEGLDDADDDRVHTLTATNLSENDLDDGVEDSSTSDDGRGVREDQVCQLCRKREVNGGKFYCTKCSFYMNRLVQP